MDSIETEVAIIGGGPAGLSGFIYGMRYGLKTVIIDEGTCAGLAAEAPFIENYMGFEGISGMELMRKFKDHASKYADINDLETVTDITHKKDFIITTDKNKYNAKAIVLCTGTAHAKLGVKGEAEFAGNGVSYCATCDGFFFKGKKVLVVGGGNSAVVDAIHLHDLGCKVVLIHRRDTLRAENALQKSLTDRGIELILGSELEEIKGDNTVTTVNIRNKSENKLHELKFNGIFISVGELPNTKLTNALGVKLDDQGYIETDKRQCTNVPKIYAAGDITGGLKQIITACAEGAIATTAAYEDLKNPYWVKDKRGNL